MSRVIVTLSGGKASAWCAAWAFAHYPKSDIVLYFNDTRWEHPDLYRFLKDLERFFGHRITEDSSWETPEDVFVRKHALANNLMPFCSRILKAERLQAFYQHGDTIIFGIGPDEMKRAHRVVSVYQVVSVKKKKAPKIVFPLIQEGATRDDIDHFFAKAGIEVPLLYRLGFVHNNCSGGCVRAGKKNWLHLLCTLPHVYAERERVEERIREQTGKDVHILKDITLRQLRENWQRKCATYEPEEAEHETECVGICDTQA